MIAFRLLLVEIHKRFAYSGGCALVGNFGVRSGNSINARERLPG